MWGVGGVVPMAAGGVGRRAVTASCSFALLSLARASEGERASDRAAGCSWGVPWGRGARVEVRRLWGVGGVVPMATGGVGPRAFTPSSFFALLSFARDSKGGKGFGSGCRMLLGNAMGPRCACRGEAGVGRGGRGAYSLGGRGSSCLHRIKFFRPVVFCKGFKRGQGLRIGLPVALGECHGAEMRLSR